MAESASRSRSTATRSGSAGSRAGGARCRARRCRCSRRDGSLVPRRSTADRSRRAAARRDRPPSWRPSITANSSPPRRATCSPRAVDCRRLPIDARRPSPTGCPRVSFTSLKRLMSIRCTRTAAAGGDDSDRRRSSPARFSRPVRSSCSAWNATRCSRLPVLAERDPLPRDQERCDQEQHRELRAVHAPVEDADREAVARAAPTGR